MHLRIGVDTYCPLTEQVFLKRYDFLTLELFGELSTFKYPDGNIEIRHKRNQCEWVYEKQELLRFEKLGELEFL